MMGGAKMQYAGVESTPFDYAGLVGQPEVKSRITNVNCREIAFA
jgi:hypothetical protein